MAVRIRSRWHEDKSPRTPEEVAGLLAANSWKIAVDKAINLHGQNFVYNDDQQRLQVIGEFLIFQVMVIDRLLYQRINTELRTQIITALVLKLAQHIQENGRNMIGEGDYQNPFIETFNRRTHEYADNQFEADAMNYGFVRCFGAEMQNIMESEVHDNRWVIDQIMDVDAEEIIKLVLRTVKRIDLEAMSDSSAH